MKRARGTKASKALDRLLVETQCRDCSVVVTKMDFAKILGKFTKVKIQYENNTSPKTKPKSASELRSPTSRLKGNENGMVHIPRKTYSRSSMKELSSPKIQGSPKTPIASTRRGQNNNILKENNRLKKTPAVKEKATVKVMPKKQVKNALKHYGVIFTSPKTKKLNEPKSKISLLDLLPSIDKSVLPTEEWSIDYLPNTDEPKVDKVYDRIAAELEGLMYSDKSTPNSDDKTDVAENKNDDFPSILDILNDNTASTVVKDLPESSKDEIKPTSPKKEVESMLTNVRENNELPQSISTEPTNIEEPTVIEQPTKEAVKPESDTNDTSIEPPGSPSILDEALKKGIEEHLSSTMDGVQSVAMETDKNEASPTPITTKEKIEIDLKSPAKDITHLVFKLMKDGNCYKSVTCPKGLKYVIEFAGKSVELLGAPKFVTSREDLQVLLQIVNESELESPYILH